MERDPMEMAMSNDIVMDIVLSRLKVIDLLSCRLTSKFWNKAASSILRKSSTMIKNISDENCLMELEECMEKSSDFPFTGLKLDKPWTLKSGCATEFFENYGTRFTRLCVDAHCKERLDVMVPFLHHFSRLTVLEKALPDSRLIYPRLKFTERNGKTLSLSSLRILRIFCSKVAEVVLGQVLLGTSPSLKIECLNTTPLIFEALKKAGKVQAVSEMKSDVSEIKSNEGVENCEYKSVMEKLLSAESPSLSKLDFCYKGCLSWDGLMKILFSSQQTLKELYLDVAAVKSYRYFWNNFPVLAKLTKLTLHDEADIYVRFVLQGRHGHNFPALKELKLVNVYSLGPYGCSNHPFIVPSVTRIDLDGYVSEHTMKQLAQVFPNVTVIRLEYECYYSSRARGPPEIWGVGAFERLERLRIWNRKVKQPRMDSISMDSFLTAMPVRICNNLRNHKKLNLIDSPWNELPRDNPSILQLKNLKELIVCLELQDGLEELPEDPPFMSMVSVWYALEMIPNLRATFTYKVPLPRSRDEERYKKVLEAALKHVRPYVNLEPFFY